MCLSAVIEEHYVKSLADNHYVKFSCDGTSSVTVQGNCIDNDLKLSSNGMLYVTDFALSTEEGIYETDNNVQQDGDRCHRSIVSKDIK